MKRMDDLITLTISVSVQAVDVLDGEDRELCEEFEMHLGVGAADASETLAVLKDLRDAIKEHRVYGWMRQQEADTMVAAGDIREETLEETSDRLRRRFAAKGADLEEAKQ